MLSKMSFKTKIIIVLSVIFISAVVGIVVTTYTVGKNGIQHSLETHAEEVGKLTKLEWLAKYKGFYIENDVLYTQDGVEVSAIEEEVMELTKDIETEITLFMAKDGDFYRLMTSLTDANGNSMAGTMLGSSHAAFSSIKNGKEYIGPAVINGMNYLTAYEPILDANGDTVVVAFAGVNVDEAEAVIMSSLFTYLPIVLVLVVVIFVVALWLTLKIVKIDITDRVLEVTNTLNGAIENVEGYTQSIADAGVSFAQDSQEQASSIEEVSASVEETSSMIQQTSEGVNETANLATKLGEAVNDGVMRMQETTETINNIKISSDEIGKIIKIIDDIASQTNILALNAAVEAARAGDAGKGFAVVAEEVRNLAHKSAEAAQSSAEIIENNINLSIAGVEMVEKVSGALAEIAEDVEKVRAIAKESDEATREQAKGMEQVAEAMKVIEKATMGTAEKAQQNVEYSKGLQNEMSNVEGAAIELKRILGSN